MLICCIMNANREMPEEHSERTFRAAREVNSKSENAESIRSVFRLSLLTVKISAACCSSFIFNDAPDFHFSTFSTLLHNNGMSFHFMKTFLVVNLHFNSHYDMKFLHLNNISFSLSLRVSAVKDRKVVQRSPVSLQF